MWKKILSVIVLSLAGVAASGQGSGKGDAAINSLGQGIPFPSIRVCTANAATQGGNTSSPCTPLDTIYTDSTLSAPAANPFFGDANGNYFFFATPGWHTVQVCATGVSCFTYQTLLAPDAQNMASYFFATATSNSCTGLEAACSPAVTGTINLGPNDDICWRNNANTADVCMTKNSSDQIVGTFSSATVAQSLLSASANPAASGVIRVAKGDTACWRNEANTADVCVSKNTSDYVAVSGSGLNSSQYQTATAAPAASGVVRLAKSDQICFRNNANTADICISLNVSDQIVGATGAASSVVSTTVPHAATGIVQMAAGDTLCWRNAGNTADICLVKNALDQVVAQNAQTVTSATLNPAGSGTIRVAKTDTACWRNNGNTADICISLNASDQFNVAAIMANMFVSSTANPAASGDVRLAKTDNMCWRNNANTADVCESLNASDQIVGQTELSSIVIDAASCNNATAAPGFDLPISNAPTVSCDGTNERYGHMDWAAGGTQKNAFIHFRLPTTWTGSIDARFKWFTFATANSTTWQIATGCATDGTTVMTSGPTLNAANSVTTADNATANTLNNSQILGITTTGCSAGQVMFVAVSRSTTDTNVSTASLVELDLTIRRTSQ